ncbi:hypothetical protein P7C70_g9381, partial [Phenoliferia sp. Uapishka_3]
MSCPPRPPRLAPIPVSVRVKNPNNLSSVMTLRSHEPLRANLSDQVTGARLPVYRLDRVSQMWRDSWIWVDYDDSGMLPSGWEKDSAQLFCRLSDPTRRALSGYESPRGISARTELLAEGGEEAVLDEFAVPRRVKRNFKQAHPTLA